VFLHNLLNVLVQIANKMGFKKIIYMDKYSPQGSHNVERIVESCLLWIVFQCEYGGVHEHPPSYNAQEDNAIARW
jgi:hypothetical protein